MRTTPWWTWRLNNSGVKRKKNTSCSSCTWTAASATQAMNDSSESFSLYFFTTVSGTVPCPWLAWGQRSWGKRNLQRWAQLQGAGSPEHNASSQDPNSYQENLTILSLLVFKTTLTSMTMGTRVWILIFRIFPQRSQLLDPVKPGTPRRCTRTTLKHYFESFFQRKRQAIWLKRHQAELGLRAAFLHQHNVGPLHGQSHFM